MRGLVSAHACHGSPLGRQPRGGLFELAGPQPGSAVATSATGLRRGRSTRERRCGQGALRAHRRSGQGRSRPASIQRSSQAAAPRGHTCGPVVANTAGSGHVWSFDRQQCRLLGKGRCSDIISMRTGSRACNHLRLDTRFDWQTQQGAVDSFKRRVLGGGAGAGTVDRPVAAAHLLDSHQRQLIQCSPPEVPRCLAVPHSWRMWQRCGEATGVAARVLSGLVDGAWMLAMNLVAIDAAGMPKSVDISWHVRSRPRKAGRNRQLFKWPS